ncbi:MAG TPA: hypothetical protein VFB14_20930 [Bryobacteraceae bacterium]|jgi:hypothetical protein|nr:hypothetical protein [Bryobacteraceae bacterium]
MRRIESVILAIVVGFLGVGVWRAQPLFPAWNSQPEAVRPAAASVETGGAVWLKGTRAPIRPLPSHRDIVLRAAIDSGSTTVVPVLWAASIPRAGQMMIGATSSELRRSFGDPMLETALLRDGHLIQRYYYFNSDQTQFTMATLENGRVVSAVGPVR